MRRFPVLATLGAYGGESEEITVLYRVRDWLTLNFGASYGITDNINVWVQADNLTNRRNIYAPGLPTAGITIAAGLGLKF